MASLLETLVAGPSLSFVSKGEEFKLLTPWTLDHVVRLSNGQRTTLMRELLGERVWRKWLAPGRRRAELDSLIKDSFVTLGVDPEKFYELVGHLSDDQHCAALEADCIELGTSITKLSLTQLYCVFMRPGYDTNLGKVMTGWKHNDWDITQQMLADIADLLNYNTMMTHIQAQLSGLKKKVKPPKPFFRRPNTVTKFSTPADLKRLMRG